MDNIIIRGLEVYAYHGVYENEKAKGQRFVINAKLDTDTLTSGMSDEIEDTLDYGKVCEFINEFMLSNRVNLLETLVNDLARKLLLKYRSIQAIDLEICKPDAPIPVKFENVSVRAYRARHTAYIAVGSNMGDREEYIKNALDNLSADECIEIKAVSSLIETKPYGDVPQDDFLNGAFKITTLYSPEELLARLHIEENEAGRERTIHWGPRTLDLDILLYDDVVMSTDSLVIPHPDMTNRLFVLVPLCEIAPNAIHSRFMLTAKELLEKLNAQTN